MTKANSPVKARRTRKPLGPPTEWASDTQLAQRYAVSRATIWRWTTEGILPPPVKLGPNCTRWKLADVTEALEGAAGERASA